MNDTILEEDNDIILAIDDIGGEGMVDSSMPGNMLDDIVGDIVKEKASVIDGVLLAESEIDDSNDNDTDGRSADSDTVLILASLVGMVTEGDIVTSVVGINDVVSGKYTILSDWVAVESSMTVESVMGDGNIADVAMANVVGTIEASMTEEVCVEMLGSAVVERLVISANILSLAVNTEVTSILIVSVADSIVVKIIS